MRLRPTHPDQIDLDWSKDPEIERIIEARVAIRAEAAALRWRFRLIMIETVLMASLVLAAGITLKQPAELVLRGAVIVGAACLASGLLLIVLSGLTGRLIARYRRWRGQ
ncbi:hypothetical protein KFK14_09965 [Sphingobium phenoxybenzoativorans]|jgi:hypothetical protein|uniref:Uncharacterized protein n=1 Tax=Sphingobium phenoxybenzoativorans TaxID=1592790 RepID=A0A975Q3M2_9SPHN|nr:MULTISPECIES: hypothetical protein [Sphingobium]QUT07677.1 hypothetical protein KFK14_09965 [Sphingobium phenoxybenzoativorans]